jgi:hypothetical protein
MSRRPVLDAAAKAQLWGLAVSGALSLLLVYRSTTMGLGPYVIGAGVTWAIWEFFWGRKLALGPHAVRAALLSGLAIPWGGVLLACALAALRP